MSMDPPESSPSPGDPPGLNQAQWDQPYGSPSGIEPPPKKGLSCGCMVLIACGIVGVLAVLVCCGGFMFAGYYFNDAVSDDPAVVAEVAKGLAELDVPEGLEPAFSLNFTHPFTGEPVMVGAVYVDEAAESMLVLGSFGEALDVSGQDQEEFWRQMENSLQQQGVQQELNVNEWERSDKEIVVRGQPTTFHFATGEDEEQETQYIKVTGAFEGENGQVMLRFVGDAEKYDEETIVEMLESVR
ncbi:MAG: hypothetical protein HQ582_26450 [Planctomycetes bacterium]|nr:hypothetical protein [Planctomycetota bacterium]